jgi:pimeloyl-ACP methyl ester carboxylesterase
MEEVLTFGEGGFGILTPARSPARGAVVVLFNAGLIHRPGPLRLHVDLARRLAASGFDVFRFDLPGIGDAGMNGAAQAKAVQALDALAARTGARAFLVGGICSAADLAWRMATLDDRIRGLVLVDPMAVRGGWYRFGRLRMLLGTPLRELLGKLGRRLRRMAPGAEHVPSVEDYREWPSPAEFRARLAEALDRGVRVLGLYTGGVSDYLLHPRQIDATFGALRVHAGLRLEFHPELDHILFAARDRCRVVEAIAGWADGAVPAAGG